MDSKKNSFWTPIIVIALLGTVFAMIVARPLFREPPADLKLGHVNESTFLQEVLESEVPVLVDFYADWCGPCQQLAPVLEELAAELPDAKIVKVNVDENPALSRQYGISSIPNLLVFKDGQIATNHVGLATKAELKAMLTQ